MSASAGWRQSESRRKLAGLVGRMRRRFYLVSFASKLLIAAPVCGVMLVPVSVLSEIEMGTLAWIGLAASALAAALLAARWRHEFVKYVELADRHYDAAGRIVAAVEFFKTGDRLGPFEKLAIDDALIWIDEHPRKGLPWRLRLNATRVVTVSVCMFILAIAGCEAPQRIPEREARYQPEKQRPYPAERSEQPKSQPAEEGPTPVEETVATTEQERIADGDETGSGVNEEAEAEQPGSVPTSAPSDESVTTETQMPDAPGNRPADEPSPEKPEEPSAGAGSEAGTEEAEQKPEEREVESPEEEVQARETDEDETGAIGPEVEGEGEAFTEAAPPVATQPAKSVDYRDARRQDLTRERVSPARRALIERYFRKLQQQNKQTPTSQPASQPTTQTTRKAS